MEPYSATKDQHSRLVGSVLKAMSILHCFDPSHCQQSITDLSQRLAMPKSTVHALVKTLLVAGLLEQDPQTGQYCLSPGIIALTRAVRVNVELRDRAAPILRELADACRESAYLAILRDDHILYVYAVESPTRLLARTAVGDRARLHTTSLGKAILAHLPPEEAQAILARTGLAASTEASITDMGALLADLQRTRERGYAVDLGEHERGSCCVGAPIFNAQGRVIAACSVSGRRHEGEEETLKRWAARVVPAADSISRCMGYVPAAPSLIVGPAP